MAMEDAVRGRTTLKMTRWDKGTTFVTQDRPLGPTTGHREVELSLHIQVPEGAGVVAEVSEVSEAYPELGAENL